jgi:hypothetical protein
MNEIASASPRPPNAPAIQAMLRNCSGITVHVSAATTTTRPRVMAVRITTESTVIRSWSTAGPPGVPVCHVEGSV